VLSRFGTTPDKLIALNEQFQALRNALLRSVARDDAPIVIGVAP
jgi:hypothetical protein